jgi:hypothetical protein
MSGFACLYGLNVVISFRKKVLQNPTHVGFVTDGQDC